MILNYFMLCSVSPAWRVYKINKKNETFTHAVHICGQACECIFNVLVVSQMMFDKNMAIIPKDPLVGIQREGIFEVSHRNVL